MNGDNGALEKRRSLTLDRFLLTSTDKVLRALENMFEFDIEQSESLLEIAAVRQSDALRSVGDGQLYTVASELRGDLCGNAHILIRASDIDHLAEMLKPVMGLMFLSRPGADLLGLERNCPGWLRNPQHSPIEDPEFRAQLLDALVEMGNVLFGVYSRGMYDISARRTTHTLPQVTCDIDRQAVYLALEEIGTAQQHRLVIDNAFRIGGRLVRLWFVICLRPDCFRTLMRGIDAAAVPQSAIQVSQPCLRAAGA